MKIATARNPDKYIASLPITYTAEFVPQSRSRYARLPNRKGAPGDGLGPYYYNKGGYDGKGAHCLNWRISIQHTTARLPALEFDYSQGIAHLPNYDFRLKLTGDVDAALRQSCEDGKEFSLRPVRLAKIRAPLLADILYSLVIDAGVLHTSGFEEWASDYGYDTDSRKAEKTYDECLKQSLRLSAILGPDALSELSRLFQDY